jgi:hypothetical protein
LFRVANSFPIRARDDRSQEPGDFSSYGNSSTNAYGFSGYPFAQGLMGRAEIVNAQGPLHLSNEQSWMMHEQGRQAKIQARRKLFDEYRNERENTASS